MNRLQKKCFFAASGFHLLLLVILIVGPAFLLSADKPDDTPVLTFIPMMTTDKAFAGGGNPNAKPPPAAPAPVQPAPPQPEPQVQPKPAPAPEPQKVTPPEPAKKDPDGLEPAKSTKPKIQVNTKLVKRQDVKKPAKTSPDTSAADAREEAARAKAFKVAASKLRDGLSSSTTVEMVGPGGGGPTYARYRDVVQKMYYDAWIEPNTDAGIGTASIVIARDGTVISAQIIQSSGDATVDRSIQAALDRVKFIAPFPDGATEQQRTYSIRFNLEAKKSLG